MIISVIIPTAVFAIILLVIAGFKQDKEKGGDLKMKSAFTYLVLFSTLMMTIGGSIGVFMSAADIVVPAPYHQSFEEFKRWGSEKPAMEKESTQETEIPETELKQQYEAMVQTEKERQVLRAKNTLIKSFGWIAIPLPIFIFYQRRLSKNYLQQ